VLKIIKIRYPLDIHCWGGLGSQLYAISLAFRLSNRFPRRRLKIIFHTAGVTRRTLELVESSIPFPISTIDDFRLTGNSTTRYNWRGHLKSGLKSLFAKSHFLAQVNSEQEFENLRKRVIQIRGHYSCLNVPPGVLTQLLKLIDVSSDNKLDFGICRIHLRLGDLLTLTEKSPINLIHLRRIILMIKVSSPNVVFQIFSDSDVVEVEKYLSTIEGIPRYTVLSGETKTVIQQCLTSEFFIGTTSKISTWICAFRSQTGLHSYIPISAQSRFLVSNSQDLVTIYD
jgi:hypothetical protein